MGSIIHRYVSFCLASVMNLSRAAALASFPGAVSSSPRIKWSGNAALMIDVIFSSQRGSVAVRRSRELALIDFTEVEDADDDAEAMMDPAAFAAAVATAQGRKGGRGGERGLAFFAKFYQML